MKIREVAPVFHVSDIERSIAFYRDVLGFTEDFRIGVYAGIKLDAFSLHLSQAGPEGGGRPVGGGTVYIFCDDVDGYFHSRISGKDVTVIQPPADQAYGMRDCVLLDPDGNQLSFGQDV
jgi:catechol 2,3-dioxygenase-like lactoylglutathione lyase family enzyme